MKIRHRKGLKEAAGAITAGIGAALLLALAATVLWSLAGCAGFRAAAEVEHHSNLLVADDRETVDIVGVILQQPLGLRCGRYCPEIDFGVHYEIRKPWTFSEDNGWVGTIRLRQPLWYRD